MAENEKQGSASADPKLLKVHHLRPAPGAKTARTRVGRGEGSKGKTAGRGTKGTKARYQVPERFEGGQMPLHMRLPKLRGFTNPFRTEYQVVNLDRLSALYPDGGDVTGAEVGIDGGCCVTGALTGAKVCGGACGSGSGAFGWNASARSRVISMPMRRSGA